MSTTAKLDLKGLFTETEHEKYGITKSIKLSGKTGKYPHVNVEVVGEGLCKMSIGSEKTDKVDANGDAIWVPVLRIQKVAASVPTKPPKAEVAKSFKTSQVVKTPADADALSTALEAEELREYQDFLTFRAMKAKATK